MHNRYVGSVRADGDDSLLTVTATVTKPTARRALILAAATLAVTVVPIALAGPASAEVPIGWAEDTDVSTGFVLLWLVGGPLVLFGLIFLAVYLPGMVRGDTAAASAPQDQWLGGRKSADALPAGSSDQAGEDGGASARW